MMFSPHGKPPRYCFHSGSEQSTLRPRLVWRGSMPHLRNAQHAPPSLEGTESGSTFRTSEPRTSTLSKPYPRRLAAPVVQAEAFHPRESAIPVKVREKSAPPRRGKTSAGYAIGRGRPGPRSRCDGSAGCAALGPITRQSAPVDGINGLISVPALAAPPHPAR